MTPLRNLRCLPLLAVVMVAIFTSPLIARGGLLGVTLGLSIAGLTAWTGYLLVGTGRWLRIYAIASLALIALWVAESLWGESAICTLTAHIIGAVLVATTFYIVLRHALLERGYPPVDRILAAACGYLLIGLLWVRFYAILIHFDPGALADNATGSSPDHPAIVYYSLVTLTTQGYGDIVPVGPFTRLIAATQGALGTLYLAVVISALVGSLRITRENP